MPLNQSGGAQDCRSAAFEEQMVAHARSLAAAFAEREPRTLERRSVVPENIHDLRDAGLFKLLQPTRWGGYDAPSTVVARVIPELAKGCASTAWVYGILGVHHMMMSGFGEAAQHEVWGEDPGTVISSSLAPRPAADTPEGGLRFSGELPFSSGCEHATWIVVVGISPTRGPLVGLIPKSDVDIVDDWHTLGLRGTGSRTLHIRDVHIPAHRIAPVSHCLAEAPRASAEHPDSLWDTRPNALFGIYNYLGVPLGLAERALEMATDLMKTPNAFGRMRGEMETLQMRFGEAAGDIQMTHFQALERCRKYDRAMADRTLTRGDYLELKRDAALMVWRLRRAVEQLTEINNGWIYDRSPLQRVLRDIVTASAHRAANPEDCVLAWSKATLGL